MPSQKVSSAYLSVGALLAISCLCIVEFSKVFIDDPAFYQKEHAAQLTLKAFEILKAEKERLGIAIDSNLVYWRYERKILWMTKFSWAESQLQIIVCVFEIIEEKVGFILVCIYIYWDMSILIWRGLPDQL